MLEKMKNTLLFALCALLFSCANPLKGKSPYWYNGYVYGTQAYGFFAQGKLLNAIASYKKGLAEAERYDIPQQVTLYKFNIGRCYYELDQFDSALSCFSACNREYLFMADTAAACRSAGYAALCWCAKGNPDSSFIWYKQGAEWTSEKNDQALWLLVHGRLLWARDHGKEALNYFEEAFSMYKKQKAYNAMARTCYYRAGVYFFFGDYPEARKLIEEALAWGDKSQERFNRWRVACAAATICFCQKDQSSGAWFYQRAVKSVPQGIVFPPQEKIMECSKNLF
jgi:tetratricopeptide (TPR) repeat protein